MSIRGGRGKARGRKFACQNWATLLTPKTCWPFPSFHAVDVSVNSSFPSAYLSQNHRTRGDALIHHRVNEEGTAGGPGSAPFPLGSAHPSSSRWVVVDGEDDATLVGGWRPIVSWPSTLGSSRCHCE